MPDRNPPNDRLYRYLSLQTPEREGWARDIFVKHELYFSSPTSFNNPFDCKVPPLDSLPRKQRQQFIDGFLLRHPSPPSARRQEKRAAKRKLSTKATFAELTQYMQENIDACGLLCLSERNDDILMWSHYADSHKGICLEFEATANTPLFGEAQPVEYTETYTDFPLLEPSKQVERALLTKSSQWRYEGEWRIIRRSIVDGKPAGSSVRRSVYSPKYLRGIVFGCQCPADTVRKVTSWIGEGGCEVTRYRARRKPKEYGLDIIPLV